MPYDNKVQKVLNKMETYNPRLTVVSIKKYGFMYLINALHSLKPPFAEMDSLYLYNSLTGGISSYCPLEDKSLFMKFISKGKLIYLRENLPVKNFDI